MIWLTWRQLRAQAAVLFGAVALVAVLLIATRTGLAGQYRRDGSAFLTRISGMYSTLYLLGALLVLAVPCIVGMFWGAPLITRELETGTGPTGVDPDHPGPLAGRQARRHRSGRDGGGRPAQPGGDLVGAAH